MRLPKRPHWAIAVVAAVSLAAGCSDEDGPRPEPASPFKKPTSPRIVLENLEQAYRMRDVAQYDSLLSVAGADSASVFLFEFAVEDMERCNTPLSWGRDTEMCATTNILASERVQSIMARLTFGDAHDDGTPGHEGQKIINVTDAYLAIVDRPDGQVEPTTYLIQGQRADFRFKVQRVDAKGDSLWRIVHWKDRGVHGAAAPAGGRNSWGCVKHLFSAGCPGG